MRSSLAFYRSFRPIAATTYCLQFFLSFAVLLHSLLLISSSLLFCLLIFVWISLRLVSMLSPFDLFSCPTQSICLHFKFLTILDSLYSSYKFLLLHISYFLLFFFWPVTLRRKFLEGTLWKEINYY